MAVLLRTPAALLVLCPFVLSITEEGVLTATICGFVRFSLEFYDFRLWVF